ncbi:hypothetical protein GCM10020227_52760 [Streptomyces flavovirens]
MGEQGESGGHQGGGTEAGEGLTHTELHDTVRGEADQTADDDKGQSGEEDLLAAEDVTEYSEGQEERGGRQDEEGGDPLEFCGGGVQGLLDDGQGDRDTDDGQVRDQHAQAGEAGLPQ